MSDYSKLKVAELKEILQQRGISLSGLSRKQQFIDTLVEDDTENGGVAPSTTAVDNNNDDENADTKRSTRANNKRKASSPVPAADVPAAKAKKTKAAPKAEPKSEIKSESDPDKVDSGPKIGEGQFAKSSNLVIPVDEGCNLSSSYKVYVDPDDGIIYDAALNQANASNNNNKFYRVQLLQDAYGMCRTWTRWGRVGEHGQSALLGDGSLEDAMMHFEKKFKDKTGLTWENRQNDPKPKKYVFVERSYEDDEDEDNEDQDTKEGAASDGPSKLDGPSKPAPECTLEKPVRSLMELIFNQKYFADTMQNLNYDANKLPLGKLSKATITRGFQCLKQLSAIMNGSANTGSLEDHSNQYYSYIPHSFGRTRPPVIQTQDLLKREIELLESLSDLKDADDILKVAKESVATTHPLDARFQGLGMQEMTPLSHESEEFSELSDYLIKTKGVTHCVKYEVEDIFRIERQGEFDRFNNSNYANYPTDRRLLWHGSRVTNFGGILSQGLRIAPPEAPVSGYMFDKGIYLADMSSKSANYCVPSISGDHALLLLCEAELGDPMQVLQQSQYNAAETAKDMGAISTWGQGRIAPKGWKDASCVHPSLAGTMMPDTTEEPGNTDVQNTSLYYNEFICYDVAQIKLRYLLRVKM